MSFVELPAEIRNEIYLYCIGDTTVVNYEPNWSTFSQKATGGTKRLALSDTCKQIRKEYLSLWMSTVTVRVSLCRLDGYLQKFHALQAHANVHLLLPHNNYRPYETDSVTDVTLLYKLMTQNDHFTLTVIQTDEEHELEAQQLQNLLRNVSQKARPLLDSIVAVRVTLRQGGRFVRTSPNVKEEQPAVSMVLFTFREHSTLPGEWPWYGAHDLNHESLLLWKHWMEDQGASGSHAWHVRIAALRGTEEANNWMTI